MQIITSIPPAPRTGTRPWPEAAQAAVRQGLRELCITDHVDTIHWGTLAPRDDFDWEESRRQFHEAQTLWGDRITLRRGAELGEAQLSFDRADRLLAGEELDFVIGSVHLSGKSLTTWTCTILKRRQKRIMIVSSTAIWTMCWPWPSGAGFRVLGHLTLPLRYINEHHGEHMTFRRHMDRVEEIFRTIIPQGVGIECNTNRGNEPLPGEDILRLYRSLGGEIITLGSDARTGRRTWAASSGSARSFCGPAASAISPHLNGAGRSFRPCDTREENES
ncbi:MAG: PHP domain-containing protein [Oscillospiraceae bacterium]